MQEELASFGPITASEWVKYVNAVIKPGLDYAKTRFIDLNVENKGRGAYEISEGLHATHAFTAAGIFNPEELARKDLDQVISHLNELEIFEFVTKEMVDNAVMEAYCVLNHTRSHSKLLNININHHEIVQK